MQYKDIDGKFADKMRMILYDMVKDFIDWSAIQRFFPDPILLYSHKKRCQMLLALSDSMSNMGYKFNVNDRDQRAISMKYLKSFRFSKSFKYMKAYRFNFLLDPFNMWPDFDRVLKGAKYSFADALLSVNIASMSLISEMATTFADEATAKKNEIDPNISAQDQIELMYTSSIVCKNLTELSEKQHCNFMRCVSNVVGLIFDIQAFASLAFDDDYADIQINIDEFEKKKIMKRFGHVIDVMIENLGQLSSILVSTSHELNVTLMKNLKTHSIHLVIPHYDFELDFDLTYEDPLIIEQ